MAIDSVYALVCDHFGERPNESLSKSLRGRPTPRLPRLFDEYQALVERAPQRKPIGQLRPYIFMPSENNGMIIGPKPPGLLSANAFRHLFLYCHAVAFEDRLGHAIWREFRQSPAPLLVSVSSVIGYYSEYFGDLLKDEVAVPLHFNLETRWSGGNATAVKYKDLELEAALGSYAARLGLCAVADAVSTVNEALGAANEHSHQADLWLPRHVHLQLAKKHLASSQLRIETPGTDIKRMIQIGKVRVPNIRDLSNRDVIAIRKSDETFGAWRNGLSTALTEAVESRRSGLGADITSVLRTRMAELQLNLGVKAPNKDLKKVAAKGFRAFSIGTLGSVVAAAAASNYGVGATLAGGAAASAADAVIDASQGRTSRLAKRALANHFTVLLRDAGT